MLLRARRWRALILFLAGLAGLGAAAPVFADEGHGGPGVAAFTSAPVLWGVLSLAGILAMMLVSRAMLVGQVVHSAAWTEGSGGFLQAVRQFSRNARLYLTYSLLSELGGGIWAVMFNLYLLRLDFSVGFIGTFWLVNMICHGAASLPVGLLADKYGRRAAFFSATALSIVAQAGVLLTEGPVAILVLGGIAGLGQAAHGVTGAPFMMENSEPRERPYLFSLNSGFLQLSRFGGSLAGGVLPLLWAATLGVPEIDPEAARVALITGLPLTVMATLPLVFIQERKVELVGTLKDLITLRNVVSVSIVVRLTLLSLIFGTAFGLTVRFFNIFFEDVHAASDGQIGAILALGSAAGASSIFLSPVVAQRFGKAAGIMMTQGLSVPFLLLMAVVPSFSTVAMIFLMRSAVYGIAMPLREQLNMEFITARERGTTAGFTHTAFDLGGGLGAGVAALLITNGEFLPAFSAASALIIVPAVLYYRFFSGMEARSRGMAAASAPAAAAGGS